ncbi:TetR/AcrR family transcriptional regulator [Mycolicibacterium sp. PDY-3]|uniref:TetR/AcrR family transcriptional regulator n=1 Tax=Mycolicibacterium sp. PDY-3 TaxID=3376069 RepID=UPI0037A92C91
MTAADTELPDYKRARRAQIVDAALDLLKSQDYEQIQMRDVADHAGVALGTLYRYFTSKENVYAAVLMQWAQPVFAAAEADLPATEQQVREKMRGIISSFERRPAFFKVCMLLQNTTDANARNLMDRFASVAQRTLATDFASMGNRNRPTPRSWPGASSPPCCPRPSCATCRWPTPIAWSTRSSI